MNRRETLGDGDAYARQNAYTPMKTKTAIISIENLTEDGISELSTTLAGQPGVEEVDFSLERQVTVIEFDPEKTTTEKLMRSVLLKGYKVL